MGRVSDAAILHHVCIVLIFLWLLNSYDCCHPLAYFVSLIYLYLVHEGYVRKLRKKLQFEEKRDANQRRVLLDSETVRWLNLAVEKMWPVCMEEIISQKILLPIAPWFLKKYKPWTAKDIVIQHFYLGRSPPIFTDIRVVQNSSSDDHLVLELGMNFQAANDMSGILSVKLRKRLGFGMWAKLHLLGMHIEGKVLVGLKFLQGWPFIGRLRICFSAPPYFQMIVKPVFTHGFDVTELPGISGWIDNLFALVFEQTLVEPNMLVVDVEKFVSPQSENWFSVDAKDPIAQANVEVLEGAEMKPTDWNGLADPYVKGQLGPFRFQTKTQKKTLAPKWLEEFKIPIFSWDSQNILIFEVHDKEHLCDDIMGNCSVDVNKLRDGRRYDMWLPLRNIKQGRIRIAVSVLEVNEKGAEPEPLYTKEGVEGSAKTVSFEDDPSSRGFETEKPSYVADKFEAVDVEGQKDTKVWIQHLGSVCRQVWEPREGKVRLRNSRSVKVQVKGKAGQNECSSSSDDSMESKKHHRKNRMQCGLRKIGFMFYRDENFSTPRGPSPQETKVKTSGVKLVMDDDVHAPRSSGMPKDDVKEHPEEKQSENQHGNVKHVAKSILKQAGKSARGLKSAIYRKRSTKHSVERRPLTTDKNACSEHNAFGDNTSSSSTCNTLAESGLLIPGSSVQSPSSVSDSSCSKSKGNGIPKKKVIRR